MEHPLAQWREVTSRKAVAEHPLAVEGSTVLCSSCIITTYSQLRQRAGNLTEVSAIANFTRAVSNYALFF